ncbi:MAG TPA: C39 family peptidase [Kofleriaceae bacterium]|nr:C39 family peptidase [Kofleriaceae bacterium]
MYRFTFLFLTACVADVSGTEVPDTDPITEEGTRSGSGSASELTLEAQQPWKVLEHQYQAQQTGYWCGPASTRMALSTISANLPTQQMLANELPTSTNGTDHIGLVVNALNQHVGARYAAVLMPHDPPTAQERDQLWRDIRLSIDAGHGIVANIVAPASNHPPGYPGYTIYHYISLIGYNADTKQVYVADPARFSGIEHYWLSFDQAATLIPPKGYATYRCGVGRTIGDINAHYQALGGCGSFLGPALTDELTTPDGAGRYNVFANGSIYWSPFTGAFEVHGAIRDKYMETGWEAGPLGYPVSDEHDVAGGRRSDFEHGAITWDAATHIATVTMN